MRKIKFRGKTFEGEWVYGSHVPFSCSIAKKYKHLIIVGNGTLNRKGDLVFPDHSYYVIEETIGQYTGLKDNNGKEVYEDDLIKVRQRLFVEHLNSMYKDAYHDFKALVVWDSEYRRFYLKDLSTGMLYDIEPSIHITNVIGNIHDNPELLEK